jgi:hypothetical protein
LVKSLGIPASMQVLEHARGYFAGKLSGEELLALTPPQVVQGLSHAMVQVFERRADLFRTP